MKVYKLVFLIADIKESTTRIFLDEFVKLYKNHCKLIYKNKIYDLKSKFNIEDRKSDYLRIKLISSFDIPYINYFIPFNGQVYESFEDKRNYEKNPKKAGIIISRSFYDVSMWVYKINPNEKRVRIFGEKFVKNNKDKYILKYGKKYFSLNEYFQIENITSDNFDIVLIGRENKSDKSYMFHKCNLLEEYYIFSDTENKKNS